MHRGAPRRDCHISGVPIASALARSCKHLAFGRNLGEAVRISPSASVPIRWLLPFLQNLWTKPGRPEPPSPVIGQAGVYGQEFPMKRGVHG
jgi:hypothetical protein